MQKINNGFHTTNRTNKKGNLVIKNFVKKKINISTNRHQISLEYLKKNINHIIEVKIYNDENSDAKYLKKILHVIKLGKKLKTVFFMSITEHIDINGVFWLVKKCKPLIIETIDTYVSILNPEKQIKLRNNYRNIYKYGLFIDEVWQQHIEIPIAHLPSFYSAYKNEIIKNKYSHKKIKYVTNFNIKLHSSENKWDVTNGLPIIMSETKKNRQPKIFDISVSSTHIDTLKYIFSKISNKKNVQTLKLDLWHDLSQRHVSNLFHLLKYHLTNVSDVSILSQGIYKYDHRIFGILIRYLDTLDKLENISIRLKTSDQKQCVYYWFISTLLSKYPKLKSMKLVFLEYFPKNKIYPTVLPASNLEKFSLHIGSSQITEKNQIKICKEIIAILDSIRRFSRLIWFEFSTQTQWKSSFYKLIGKMIAHYPGLKMAIIRGFDSNAQNQDDCQPFLYWANLEILCGLTIYIEITKHSYFNENYFDGLFIIKGGLQIHINICKRNSHSLKSLFNIYSSITKLLDNINIMFVESQHFDINITLVCPKMCPFEKKGVTDEEYCQQAMQLLPCQVDWALIYEDQ